MGYIKHELVAVTFYQEDSSLEEWLDDNVPDKYKQLFVKIPAAANGYFTYVMAPDGSKEGWEPSNECDLIRNGFKAFAKNANFDVVHVAFGGDYKYNLGATIEDEVYVGKENDDDI